MGDHQIPWVYRLLHRPDGSNGDDAGDMTYGKSVDVSEMIDPVWWQIRGLPMALKKEHLMITKC